MKPSTLALQIALFHYVPNAAFVHQNVLVAKPRHHRHTAHGARRYKKELSSLVGKSSAVSQASSSCSSANVIELSPFVRQRHPLFAETNAVSKHMPVPHLELWRQSLPTLEPEPSADDGKKNAGFWDFLSPQKEHGHSHGQVLLKDRHVEFDNASIGARDLLEKCGVILPSSKNDESSSSLPLPETIMAEKETVKHLTSILSYFQTVAAPTNGSKNIKCIARIVSTEGSAGIKCPRWHADHVPVRLVMSILGPGCEYIPENIAENDQPQLVNRQALNNLDEDDTMKANDIIVPPALLYDDEAKCPIRHADEGEAVLLMGRGWEDDIIPLQDEKSIDSSNSVLAAVHRSPTLLPDQERILLTVDLVDRD